MFWVNTNNAESLEVGSCNSERAALHIWKSRANRDLWKLKIIPRPQTILADLHCADPMLQLFGLVWPSEQLSHHAGIVVIGFA
jgi:hypothetical protein